MMIGQNWTNSTLLMILLIQLLSLLPRQQNWVTFRLSMVTVETNSSDNKAGVADLDASRVLACVMDVMVDFLFTVLSEQFDNTNTNDESGVVSFGGHNAPPFNHS